MLTILMTKTADQFEADMRATLKRNFGATGAPVITSPNVNSSEPTTPDNSFRDEIFDIQVSGLS